MDEDNRLSQSFAERERIVDPLTANPVARYNTVWAILKPHSELSQWDVVCFCVTYLATLITLHDWIKEAVKRLGKLIYYMHYYMPVAIGIITQSQEDEGCQNLEVSRTKLDITSSTILSSSKETTSETQLEVHKHLKIGKQ